MHGRSLQEKCKMSNEATGILLLGAGFIIVATIWALYGVEWIPAYLKMGIVGGEIVVTGKILLETG